MGLINDVKNFVKKIIKSPIKSAIISYLIFDILNKQMKETIKNEQVKVIKDKGNRQLLFDSENKIYSVVDGRKIIIQTKDKDEAEKKFNEKINPIISDEKLNKLYEKVTGMPVEAIKIQRYKDCIEEEMSKIKNPEVRLKIREQILKEQGDPDRICGNIWFNGTDNQRSAFGKGTEGRSKEDKPPKLWWSDCVSKIKKSM